MSNPTEFGPDWYDEKYFAGRKQFRMADGSIREWGYNNPGAEFRGAKDITKAWKIMFNPRNALDCGAGRGTFIAYMRDVGIEAEGFDFSEWAIEHPYPRCKPEWLRLHDATKPWPYRDQSFDLVICLDVLEHLYEEDLDAVLSEIFRVAKKWVFLQIATVDGIHEHGFILRRGEPIPLDKDPRTWAGHVTVCTEDWWYEMLEKCDEGEEWLPRRDMVNWFYSLVDPGVVRNWLENALIVLERIEDA